jgi:hypothetical protein
MTSRIHLASRQLFTGVNGFIMMGILLLAIPPLLRANTTDGVTGKWLGSMEVTSELGEVKHYSEVMLLNQQGAVISGSVGLNEARQTPIIDGKVAGDKVKFTVTLKGGAQLGFHLHHDGDQLRGFLRGRTKLGRVYAYMRLVRVPETAAPT